MKITLIFAITISLCLGTFLFATKQASAQLAPYTAYDFNTINLYNDQFLFYQFSGMTPGDNFLVFLEELDHDGNYVTTISARVIIADGSGVGETLWFTSQSTWSLTDQFPMRVSDMFGNILSYHYIAPGPVVSWGSVVGDGDEPDKVCIAGCVYNIEQGGFHHQELLATTAKRSILTPSSQGYALLHYRCDYTALDPDDKIQIKNIETGATVFEVLITELVDYNSPDMAFGLQSACNTFVVMSLDGNQLQFIDETRDAAVSWTLDNPHTASFPVAGYSYARVDAGMSDAVIRAGMSVWGVTTDPTRINWSLTVNTETLFPEDRQRWFRRGTDEDLWTAFPEMELTDSSFGEIDPVDYEFFTFQQGFYEVDMTPTTAVVFWTVRAADLHYGQTPSDFELFDIATYTILPAPVSVPFGGQLKTTLEAYGLDSDVGSLSVFLVVLLGFYVGMYYLRARAIQMYSLAFVALAGTFILMGLTTPFANFVLGIAAIAALIATVVVGGRSGERGME